MPIALFAKWNGPRKPKLPSPSAMLFLAVLACPLLETTQKWEPGQCRSPINLVKMNEAKNLLWRGNKGIRARKREIQDVRLSRSSGLSAQSGWNQLSANNGFSFYASFYTAKDCRVIVLELWKGMEKKAKDIIK